MAGAGLLIHPRYGNPVLRRRIERMQLIPLMQMVGILFLTTGLKQENNKSRAIGVVAIVLTVISVAITIWTTAKLFNMASQLLKSLSGLGL